MEGSGGEVQLVHGSFQEFLADFVGTHFGIAGEFGACKADELAFADGLNTFTDGFGGFDLTFVGEFFIVDAGDFDVDVDAVEQGTTDAFLVAGDGHRGAATFFDWVTVVAAGAPVWVAVATNPLSIGCAFATFSASRASDTSQQLTLPMEWSVDFRKRVWTTLVISTRSQQTLPSMRLLRALWGRIS